jgi:hypothetical protein
MKRELTFVKSGKLAEALGVSSDRAAEFERDVDSVMSAGGSMLDIIEKLNERGDMTDAEWTAFIFALGYFQGSIGAGL